MQSVTPAGRGEPWKSTGAAVPMAPRRATAGPLRHRTAWRLASATVFCALCGGMVWLVTWWSRPQPIRAIYLAAGYETNLAVPHNSYGRRWTTDVAVMKGGTAAELRRDVRWDAGLRGIKSKTILLTIAAHGGTDANGPYLLPTDAAPGPAAENRLRLKAVIDRLAGLPGATKKVLLLEAGQMPANPLFGPPESDFAKGLEEVDVAAVPNLSVLTANGPGERAWPAEVHRSTAFGHFLQTGLSGAADADGDRRVTLWELYEYLAPRVEKWALQTRAAVQSPRLYPVGPEGERRARAVVVAQLTNTATVTEQALPPYAPSPALQTAWDRCAARSRQEPPPASYAPHLWRVYAASLVRAEELTLARDETAAATVLTQVRELEARLDADRRVEVNDPLLAAAVFGETPPNLAAREAVGRLWAAPPAEAAKAASQLTLSPAAYDRLIELATEPPTPNLARAAEIIRLLDRPGRPRPPTAHLLVMLAANSPPIKTPAQAEVIKTALTVRKLAETAAAAGGVGYGDRLGPWFADRLKAADAIRVRGEDRLFATDPGPAAEEFATAKAGYVAVLADAAKLRSAFLTRDRLFAELPLLANWAVRSPLDAKKSDPADEVTKLWTAAHDLDRILTPSAAVADVTQSADGLAARLDALTKAVVTDVQVLLPAPPPGLAARVGRDTVERALTVPMLPPNVRAQLWPLADRFTREASATTETVAAASAGDGAGRRSADLAAAALGKTEKQPAFTRVPQLADEVRRLLETDPTGDPSAVRTAFAAAERLARLTPAALPPYRIEPAVALRGLLSQNLALGLAERHAESLWAGDSSTEAPYYKQAAGALLSDVATLGPIDPVRDRLGKLRGRLDVPFKPTISGTVPVTTTDPAPFSVEVAIGGERADALPGFLTLSAEPPSGLTLAGAPGRRAVPWPETHRYRLDLTSAGTANEATAVAVRGFFRGWKIDGRAPVNLYPVPEVIDTVVPPPPASVVSVRASPDAVRKFGSGEGAVAIVIDCSGSMAAPEGQPATESRYLQGVTAAGRIIADLPRNTVVTVWAFGQAGEAQKKVEEAEKTISKIAGPIRRDPDDAEQVSKITGRLATLEPFNQSPIFRALLTARDDVQTAAGYRAVVLISDGLDNRSASEPGLNPKGEPLAALLRTKLRDERLVIHAVGFASRSKDDAAAGEQLRDFVEGLPTPGKYVVAPNVEALSSALRAGLSSRLTARLTPTASKPIELEVTPGGTADRWTAVKGGPYKLGTDTGPGETDARLTNGDRLLLGLDVAPTGPTFRRLSLADEFPSRPFGRSDRGDWRVTVLQNQRRGDGVAMLVGLETTGTTAQITRPADVWFDLGTDFPDLAPASVRWRPVYDYTAPVWEVLAPAWPKYPGGGSPARPTLRVWFNETGSAAATATTALKDILDANGPVTVKVGAEEVTVEAIAPALAGGPPVVLGTIALRIRHAADRPVLARLDGVGLVSSERRVYTKAGRTVALFLPADSADVRAARLTLVPLTGFKASARRIDLREMPAPDPDDNRAPSGR
ncbi:vWA domain-containing protein [Limnoglobus roseus]|uniref:VWA domain-containing protein n=1 Tax=Limnoglobus roseus TaxID=2598579 RepID=A0A5C1AKK7_9BACT|nr:vWA domain-containing protein [Limnoglobus roseus]QEL19440.1 VWA domain-containing protein [Limnoglobus roseus]